MNYEKKRIFITVKTYPAISQEYGELVCTAGLLEDGSWIRLYPVPFRSLDKNKQYSKYTWITAEVTKNTSDIRAESYRPNWDAITAEKVSAKSEFWNERRKIILDKGTVYTNLKEIIELSKERSNSGYFSLATFKPTKILKFHAEAVSRDWDIKKLDALQMNARQMSLFDYEQPTELERKFRIVQKIPYKFSYLFEDDSGKRSKLMIEDWEIGMLYLNCLRLPDVNGNEKKAIEKVKQTYFDKFLQRDIYFFLGTTLAHHFSQNPFIIIGVFYPPKQSDGQQLQLF